jgi:hypothetical protein
LRVSNRGCVANRIEARRRYRLDISLIWRWAV